MAAAAGICILLCAALAYRRRRRKEASPHPPVSSPVTAEMARVKRHRGPGQTDHFDVGPPAAERAKDSYEETEDDLVRKPSQVEHLASEAEDIETDEVNTPREPVWDTTTPRKENYVD